MEENTVINQDIEAIESNPFLDNSTNANLFIRTSDDDNLVTFDYNNVAITDIVNSIILDSINKGASDIHFDPTEEGIDVRIRIDGSLLNYTKVPLIVKKNMITRINYCWNEYYWK